MAGQKFITQSGGALTEVEAVQTGGEGSENKIAALDGNGRLDETMLPTGIGPDVALIEASENLSAGDFVNIHNATGAKVRKADATTAGKEAHGFVLDAVTAEQNATVYFEGLNDQVTSQTPGPVFLTTTAGIAGAAPSGSGNIVQRIGVAVSATAINFEGGVPITLA